MTRKDKAAQLLMRLQNGPCFSHIGPDEFTPAEASASFRRWSQSWVLTEVCSLVPELKQHLNSLGYYEGKGAA